MKRMRNVAAMVLASGLLLLPSGCGGPTDAAVVADPARARGALTRALDAWKGGQPHDSPGQLTPPVRVADEDWLSGVALVEYQIGDTQRVQSSGGTSYWPVELTLRGAGGTSKRGVTYVITTDPELSVIRQD